ALGDVGADQELTGTAFPAEGRDPGAASAFGGGVAAGLEGVAIALRRAAAGLHVRALNDGTVDFVGKTPGGCFADSRECGGALPLRAKRPLLNSSSKHNNDSKSSTCQDRRFGT